LKGRKARKVCQDRLGHKDLKGQQARKALKVRPDRKGLKVRKAQTELLALTVKTV
jgi:hypothetical protein